VRTRVVIAALLFSLGAVWIGQGVGMIHGSLMTGEAIWAVIGAVVILFGLSIVWGGLPARTSRADDDDELASCSAPGRCRRG